MTPKSPKALLDAHGLKSKKHFGQNFMVDAHLARQIAELAASPLGGTVIEIGAGLGALTRELASRARRVFAIERDRDLIEPLRAELSRELDAGTVQLLEADAKQVDFEDLLVDSSAPRVIAGNLPYHLTGPLLQKTIHAAGAIDRAVFLVQLEVAERLVAKADSPAYGALSIFVQAAFDARRALVIRRGAFYPQPNVDSAVIVLSPRPDAVQETSTFRDLVHAAFSQRRKTLRNAWRGVLGLPADALKAAADRAGVDLDARGETLDVAAFARMVREVSR